ncbi:MAG TPA: hypothetical protein VGH33_03600, partial [Isosphaeraceae bacterium]
MSETKKLLVAFDPTDRKGRLSDFVVPWMRGDQAVLLGLRSSKECALGLVIFTGRGVSANDLFARLVDSGVHIENVNGLMSDLGCYIERVRALAIGNVVRLAPDCAGNDLYQLEVVART